jgi:organic radical activating enzyme
MENLLSRIFPAPNIPDAPPAGVYQRILTGIEGEQSERLHLRIEPSGEGVLIVNAAIVLHLNQTATEHVYWWIQEKSAEEAAAILASRYRVSKGQAVRDHTELQEQILALSRKPDLDPVIFLDMDRTSPYDKDLTAPYRLDCALTYKIDDEGTYDPNARARVDRELSISEWKQILEKAWDAGIPHVTFTGGEPTLYKGVVDLIGFAESQGQITGLLTNGVKLNDANYLHQLVMTGIDHMLIAVNFDQPETLSGLQAALATDVFTAAHLTITTKNQTVINTHIEEIHAFGANAISLSAGVDDPGINEALINARDHVAHLGMDLVWDLPAPYSRRNPIDLELEEPTQGPGRAWLYVEPDGDVLPGQGVNEILGNMLRDEWQRIWKNARNRR